MGLKYRMYEDGDEPALLRLWREQSGWDNVSDDVWRHRFVNTPLGRSHIAIGFDEDSGEIAAQIVFIPSIISVDGEEVPAARPFAPIVSKKIRGSLLTMNPMNIPIVALFRTAIAGMKERGVKLTYMLPDPNWKLLFKMVPSRYQQMETFRHWTRPLPLAEPIPLGEGFAAAPVDPHDSRIDGLFQAASHNYGCMVIRDTRMIGWKTSHGGYRLTGIERGGELVGLVASLQKGETQWLICDLLAVDMSGALRASLAAACNLGHEECLAGQHHPPLRKVGILMTSRMEQEAGELGFAVESYEFPFVLHVIDDSIDRQRVAPERWYLSAND
jgi:hypothetical protein